MPEPGTITYSRSPIVFFVDVKIPSQVVEIVIDCISYKISASPEFVVRVFDTTVHAGAYAQLLLNGKPVDDNERSPLQFVPFQSDSSLGSPVSLHSSPRYAPVSEYPLLRN
ncbi:hypothetical protein N9M68_00765 [Candidatus Poseidonia alphae]|nr:hypothetical protein [Candidatus Poseidonia alphae]